MEKAEVTISFNGNEYDFVKGIGSGGFGQVYLAKERSTGNKYAIKVIDKDTHDPEYANREFENLKTLDHPNIIKFHTAAEAFKKVYILLEYIPSGDLSYCLKHTPFISEKKAKDLLRQILVGVGYLHSKKIAHRDLKPANILLDTDGTVKIVDFGLAKQKEVTNSLMLSRCGTSGYCAPEVMDIHHKGYDGFKADVFSLGIIFRDILKKVRPKMTFDYLLDKLTNIKPAARPSPTDVYFSLFDPMKEVSFFDKYGRSVLKYHDQVIPYHYLPILTSSAEVINFENVTIKTEDGLNVPFEKVFEIAVKAKKIYIKGPIVTSKTMKKLVQIPHFSNLEKLYMADISDSFDIEAFFKYMKKNHMSIKIILDYDKSISYAYKHRLDEIIDEIVTTKKFDYVPPLIYFDGQDEEKKEKLDSLFYSYFGL